MTRKPDDTPSLSTDDRPTDPMPTRWFNDNAIAEIEALGYP